MDEACGVRSIDVTCWQVRRAERIENKRFVELALIETASHSARKTLDGNLSTGHFVRGLSRPFRCRGLRRLFRCQASEALKTAGFKGQTVAAEV